MMFTISMTTLKSARKHGAPRAYLARLRPGARGSIDRLFAKTSKINDNRQRLASAAQPGDVFEARRWTWNMLRQQYEGGTIWLGVQRDGTLTKLTRDEAFAAVHAIGLARPTDDSSLPMKFYAGRVVPDDIQIFEQVEGLLPCPD